MEDVVQALMIAFSALVFIVGFTVAMYMFSQVTSTAETLVYYTDSTMYYDNIKISDTVTNDDVKKGNYRIVNAETIIPTLYRYADERFCVKIYDENNKLIQIFDLDLELKITNAIADTRATEDSIEPKQKANFAYKKIYNDPSKPFYMHGAPWEGNPENARKRVSLFINGESGYINDKYVNYKDGNYNKFSEALKNGKNFKERFISYSFDGATMTTDEGDILVTGNKPQDKIVIIYTIMP